MILKEVTLKNFRGYRDTFRIQIDDLTAIIGRNDVGKSSVLEALEIFFNNSTVNIDQDDLNVEAKSDEVYEIEIGCVFSSLPAQLTIDSNSLTSLKNEYLSFEDNDGNERLYVIKKYDASKKKPKESTYIVTPHYPTKDKVHDIHTLKIAELKKRAEQLSIDIEDVDKRNSAELRNAIWGQSNLKDEDFGEVQVSADDDEYGKKIWKSLAGYLPFYALFQSDRPSKDGDSEVQDPIKVAIGQAVKKVENKLVQIEQEVETEVKEMLDRTSKKMKNLTPQWEENDEMIPSPAKNINWATSFKYQLLGNNEIPINKRGSGMRRLILLAFFQAEADRRMKDSNAESVIYAIEEPETSQHPNHQLQLIESFQNLSQHDNTQILLTTHVPGLAQTIESEQIRYIFEEDGGKKVGMGDSILSDVGESLGVLPDPNNTVQVIVHVEGKHDVAFLLKVSELFHGNGETEIDLNNDDRFIVFPVGGSTLKDFIDLQYLKSLNKKEFHLYDSDDPSYADYVEQINNREGDDYAVQTIRLEIENYIPPHLFEHIYAERGIDISLPDFNHHDDVPEIVSKHVHEALYPDSPWEDYSGDKKNYHRRVKSKVNSEILPLLTLTHLQENGALDEMKVWFNQLELMID
ncbi:ATP-binding protein [Pleurocapsales cyanobacterium LEGE 10410]|nr:ATP-binding protein [Pleurocapsales cyanobacterium LEGE 10410]